MAQNMPGDEPTLRDYYAAERTLLAWIRTSIAMMGFGFVVARFGVFLREITAVQRMGVFHSGGLSVWFGTALVVFGVVISAVATLQYRRELRDLNHAARAPRAASALALWTVAGLGALGLLMSAYLLTISRV